MLLGRLPEQSFGAQADACGQLLCEEAELRSSSRGVEAQAVGRVMGRQMVTSTEAQGRGKFLPSYRSMLLANSEGSLT